MRKYTLSIPNPCNEKWENMTPTEKGRYCKVCQKEIYDFTKLSNHELIKKLDNNENVCAKYLKNQLNVDLYSNKQSKPRATKLLITLSSVMAISQPMVKANPNIDTHIATSIQQPDAFTTSETPKHTSDSLIIKGSVVDKLDGEPLPFATIIQKDTEDSTTTDFDGNFEMVIHLNPETGKAVLQFNYIGMKSTEVEITRNTKTLNVEMEVFEELLGEIYIERKVGFFERIGNWFRRKK